MTGHVQGGRTSHYVASMFIIGVLFFIFGFVTWLNGPLTIFVKLAFNLDDVSAFLFRWRSTCPTSCGRCRGRRCSSARA